MEIFDYDNVLLLPRKCRVESRSECDPGQEFGPRRFERGFVEAASSGRHPLSRLAAGRYLSWLSLLPLRLNPMFAGRRSRAD